MSEKKFCREDLVRALEGMGFTHFDPRDSSRGRLPALIKENSLGQCLHIFFTSGGISFVFYPESPGTWWAGQDIVDVDYQLVDNYYSQAELCIHYHILELARHFIDEKEHPRDSRFFEGKGSFSPSEKVGRTRKSGNQDMAEIYEAISSGNGEDVYLGDGMWVSSDGTMSDRGR